MKKLKVILSGGGTGGHFYPAVAVAQALKERMGNDVEILFVGALGKMEMQKVPQLGYRIEGLPVAGIQRSLSLKNLLLPMKIIKSLWKARGIIKRFDADIVIGFGGYASAPVLWCAQSMGIPTIIQEQNSFAGVTNKILGARARKICVAYEGMDKFFPAERIVMTGNPLRGNFSHSDTSLRSEALSYFGFDGTHPIILIVGGSLGTRTLNNTMKHWIDKLTSERSVDVIWQTGAYYRAEMEEFISSRSSEGIWQGAFIERMDLAYAVADVVVSRSGACTVSELCLTGKPVIFVPSPNVAEDHQTKNAMALVEKGAALMVADSEAEQRVIPMAIEVAKDRELMKSLGEKISSLAIADSASRVVDEVQKIIGENKMENKSTPQTTFDRVYFLGIGGIGMSALARYFASEGKAVAGYDRTSTPLTEALQSEGIAVHYNDTPDAIGKQFRDKATTLVVYTPAIAEDNAEKNWFINNGFPLVKRSEILGHLTQGKYVMAVAGTHGKTTTTTITAWLNHIAAGGGSAFLGGISKNFGSNLVIGSGDRMAVEADEFDRSFLRLYPDVAVITSADADHLDIYGTHQAVKEAFTQFVSQIKEGGTLIIKQGVDIALTNKNISIYRYSYNTPCDFYARNVTLVEGGHYTFDIVCPDRVIQGCTLGIPGWVNIENAIAAVSLLWVSGFDEGKLKEALASFSGVKRRFDFYLNRPDIVYMDDYAHHPRELEAAITSVKQMFPGRSLTAIFQPHLFTRTRDLYRDFATSLSCADNVILLPIYAAREEPIEGIDSTMIAKLVSSPCVVMPKEELVDFLAKQQNDVVVTFGAGDIDKYCQTIADRLR